MKQRNVISLKLFVLQIFCVFVLAACNSGGGGGSGGASGAPLSPMEAALVGQWRSTCVDTTRGSYFVSNVTYGADGSVSSHTNYYSDASCTILTSPVVDNAGTYSLGDSFMTPSGVEAYQLDVTLTSASFDGVPSTSLPRYFMDIVYIDASDRLYGAGPGLRLAGTYPSEIDYSIYSVRISGSGASDIATAMVNSWHSECLYDPDRTATSGAGPVYSIHQVQFESGGTFSVQLVDYNDPACDDSTDYIGEDTIDGTYSIGGSYPSTAGLTVTQLDMTATSSTFGGTPLPALLYGLVSMEGSTLLGEFTDGAFPADINLSNPFSQFKPGIRPAVDTCTAYDIADEPDILGDVTFSSSSVSAGNDVTVSVPIDADTGYVAVALLDTSDGSLGGIAAVTVSTLLAQTVDITVPTASATGSAVVGHQYQPSVSVCTNESSCNFLFPASGSGKTVHYSYDSDDPYRLDRGKNYDNGSITRVSRSSCVAKPSLNIVP